MSPADHTISTGAMPALEVLKRPRPPFHCLIPVPFPLLPDTSLSCFAPKPKLVPYPYRIFERAYHRRVAEINLLGEIDLLAQIIDAWQ